MPITSHIVEEGPGQGKGHLKGKGKGHDKHAEEAMADGVYTIQIAGISHDNPTAVSQTSAQTTLADGTKLNTEVRQGSITIDAVPAGPAGDHALHLVTDSDNGRLRVNVEYDANNRIELGDLEELSFDYYIASSDRTNVIPVVRLIIDADGNLATTGDRGELVFEYAYQGLGATTQDAWQSADLAGNDWVAWQRSFGQNRDQIVNMTELSDWADADGFTPAGGLNFNENSLILGYSIALGSGNGTTDVFLDNLVVGGVTTEFVG